MSRIHLLMIFLILACTACGSAGATQGVPVTGGISSLADFENQLAHALNQRNFNELKQMMGDPFGMANWNSEGHFIPLDEAIELLESSQIAGNSSLVFDTQRDLNELLGMDPLTIFGEDQRAAQAVLVDGWGRKGKDQALLLIGQRADKTYYWHSLVVAPGGFNP